MMGERRCDQDIQEKNDHTSSMEERSVFAERRVQINRSWKAEGFGSIDHALLMCGIMDPYTSRSVRLACTRALKGKY